MVIQMDERQSQLNRRLQEQWVGKELRPDVHIVDIGATKDGDMYVLCMIPTNTVHKFVTWGFDGENTFWGHYTFTVEEALIDFDERLGISRARG